MHGTNNQQHNGIKNLPIGTKIVMSQILIFGGYLKVSKSLYTQDIIWVNTMLILGYEPRYDTTILPRYEGPFMICRPKWYRKQKHPQIPP
jgi:hypothetical protein